LGTINRNNSDPSSGSFTIPLIATPTQIIDAATEQANFQIISTATGGLLDFQDDAWLILASNHALDTQTLVVPGAVLANVPELNPSSGTSAFVIVVGAALIIRGRRKLPTA
jgi:hypothetical protein